MSLKLIFIELLKVIYNLNLELESGGQVKNQRFHDIIGFGIISKINVDLKVNRFTITELHHRCSLENFEVFEGLFWMATSKVIVTDKTLVLKFHQNWH